MFQILVSTVALAASAVANAVARAVARAGARAVPMLVKVAVVGVVAAGLSGCGQQGALYLPTEPAAARRATLPETLRPGASSASPATAPASSAVPSAR